MTALGDGDRRARVALSFLADPGDPVLGAILRSRTPAEVLAAVTGAGDAGSTLTSADAGPDVAAPLRQWRERLARVPSASRLAAWQREGLRLVCPGDPDWPAQLDDLGDTRPLLLWARGTASLPQSGQLSVTITGARAATSYGIHVSFQLAAGLSGLGMAIISGGSYGIDAAAHRGAIAAGGATVAVLAGGLSCRYPLGLADLYAALAAQGVLISECPPGDTPARSSLLARNRIIAALGSGTVVVEAGLRSGALAAASHGRELGRPVMAVPGPVTSVQSAGCHQLIRDHGARCVTSEADVADLLGRSSASHQGSVR